MKAKFKCKVQSSTSNIEHRTLNSDQGIAMVVAIMTMVVLLSITGSGLLLSGLNLKTASSLKTGKMAFQAADAGIQHGRVVIENSNFDPLLQGSDPSFPTVNGKSTLTGSLSGYTYTVVVENDPADTGGATNDTNDVVIFTSTGTGPTGSNRAIKAYIKTPPGTFFITGDDTNYTDTNSDGFADSTSAGPQPSVLGIGATNQTLSDNIVNSLSNADRSRVMGLNYNGTTNPVTPSVGVPSTSVDVNQLATDLKALIPPLSPCPPKCPSGLQWDEGTCPSSSPCTLGTDAAPQITHIAGEDVELEGYITGTGVLIVEGEVELASNFEFHGLVIHVQTPGQPSLESEFEMENQAKIYGSALLGPNLEELEVEMKDTSSILYSTQAIDIAKNAWPSVLSGFSAPAAVYIPGDITTTEVKLSRPPQLMAWHEVMQ